MVSSEITNMKQILDSVWLPVWVRWANAAYLGLTTANQQKDKGLLEGLHTSYKFQTRKHDTFPTVFIWELQSHQIDTMSDIKTRK